MKKFFPYFLLFTFFHQISFAQNATQIKAQLDKLMELDRTGKMNTNEATKLFMACYDRSKSIQYALGIERSGTMLAQNQLRKGAYKEVITLTDELIKNKDLSIKVENMGEIYRIRGLAFSDLGFIDKSYKEYRTALKLIKQIKDKNLRHYRAACLYDNMTSYFDHKKISPDSISYYLQKSLEEVLKVENTDIFWQPHKNNMIMMLHCNLGVYYTDIATHRNTKLAEKYFGEALEINTKNKNIQNDNKVNLFLSLSRFYADNKNSEKAIKFANELLKVEKTASSPYPRLDIYNILSKSYLDLGSIKLSKKYMALYTTLSDSIQIAEKYAVNSSMQKVVSDEKDKGDKIIKNLVWYISAFLLVFLSALFIFWKNNNKKLHKKYEQLTQKLRSDKEKKDSANEFHEEKKNTIFTIPDDTLSMLLSKLEKFEKSERYLKKGMDLSTLAYQLNTNPKYLSEIIKQHKGKSFNGYINGLKIDYITHKLYEDPKYKLYKISHLAEICGFSSREVFSSIFKKEAGVTPSYFIENINKMDN